MDDPVLVRYGLQKGWVILLKSERAVRIEENANVFDFGLQDDEILALDELETQGMYEN